MRNKRLGKTLKKFYDKKEDAQELLFGELGIPIDGVKRVDVPGRAGYVYVRLRGNKSELVQAYNNTVPSKYNYPVIVSRKGNTYTIAGRDQSKYSNMGNIGSTVGTTPLPNHGGQHSFNPDSNMGADPVWVYSRQFMPMLSYPSGTSMTLATNPYFYEYNGQWKYIQNTGTIDFSSYVPTSGSAKMLLYWLDTRDNSYKITAGADFSEDLTSSSDLAPYIPVSNGAYSIPLMAVRLSSGTTSLTWDNMYDVRPFLHITPSGSAGGSTIYAQNEGSTLGAATTFNFVGENIDASISGTIVRVFVTGSASASVSPPITGSVVIFDDASIKGSATQISFGNGLSAVTSGTTSFIDVTSAPTQIVSNGIVVQDEGSTLGTGTILNFVGSGVTASLSGTVVNISVSGGGSGGGSRTLIESKTSTGTSVSFTSIPATYSKLILEYSARGTAAAESVSMDIALNNDTTNTNYSRILFTYYGSSSHAAGGAEDNVVDDTVNAANALANEFTHGIIEIPNYASTSFNKNIRALSGRRVTGVTQQQAIHSNIDWESTSAVNRVDLILSSGNFNVNSVFKLYGETDTSATSATPGIVVQDEGSVVGTGTVINFRGDNVVASASGTVIDVYVTGSAIVYPKQVQVALMFPTAISGSVRSVDSLQYTNFRWLGSPATSNYLEWSVLLDAGTWRMDILSSKGNNRGILTISLDGVEIGTIDLYSAATTNNDIVSLTGISVSSAGNHTLKIATPTKNASSSNYYMVISDIVFYKTA